MYFFIKVGIVKKFSHGTLKRCMEKYSTNIILITGYAKKIKKMRRANEKAYNFR